MLSYPVEFTSLLFWVLVCGLTKPNQTQPDQTKANYFKELWSNENNYDQIKPSLVFTKSNQPKPNQLIHNLNNLLVLRNSCADMYLLFEIWYPVVVASHCLRNFASWTELLLWQSERFITVRNFLFCLDHQDFFLNSAFIWNANKLCFSRSITDNKISYIKDILRV